MIRRQHVRALPERRSPDDAPCPTGNRERSRRTTHPKAKQLGVRQNRPPIAKTDNPLLDHLTESGVVRRSRSQPSPPSLRRSPPPATFVRPDPHRSWPHGSDLNLLAQCRTSAPTLTAAPLPPASQPDCRSAWARRGRRAPLRRCDGKLSDVVDGYEGIGDPDSEISLTQRPIRKQRDAVHLRDAVARMHSHECTVGESLGRWMSHTHAEDDPGHTHPGRQAFPLRPDGGYWEETGPSTGTTAPPGIAANALEVLTMIGQAPKTPDHQLVRWRLRLYCGHVVERSAHRDQRTVASAFTASRCGKCGLDPATIVAARASGLVGDVPKPKSPEPTPSHTKTLRRQLARAETDVERLRAELGAASATDEGSG